MKYNIKLPFILKEEDIICGIGIDIIEIERIKMAILKSNNGFLDFVFSDDEITKSKSLSEQNYYWYFATIFAFKESILKAIKTGWRKGIKWKDIEFLDNEGIVFHNKVMELIKEMEVRRITVTIGYNPFYIIVSVILKK